jgi:RES domain-containing protein
MTVSLWRIGTDTPDYTADDMAGKGAETTGGRWNRVGSAAVYTSTNIALAVLETLVHFNTSNLPLNRILVRVNVPDRVWAARQVLTHTTAPVGWNVFPAGKMSLDTGNAWIRGAMSALLEVPSAIVPEESNVLINPRHSDAPSIRVARLRVFDYDGRLRQLPSPKERAKP